jgi:adenylate kinase family enzyme
VKWYSVPHCQTSAPVESMFFIHLGFPDTTGEQRLAKKNDNCTFNWDKRRCSHQDNATKQINERQSVLKTETRKHIDFATKNPKHVANMYCKKLNIPKFRLAQGT